LNGFHDWIRSPLGVALILSVLAHAMVIGGLGFIKPGQHRLQDKLSVLEVVLVNAKTKEIPVKADALAQSNLDRGGNTEENRRAKSPLPVPEKRPNEQAVRLAAESKRSKVKAASTPSETPRKQQREAEQEKEARQVLTQAQSRQAIESEPTQQMASVKPEQGQQEDSPKTIDTTDMVARSLEAIRLEAMISRSQEEYNKRPKRKFFGARVREYRFAAYVESWRQKVEKVGNLNYPEAAKAQKLYGQLRMTVSIQADGNVEKIELNQSSGHKVLDDAARRIVELAAPYAEFPPEVRKDTDIIEITRTWTFTREDTLASGE
jgi:protein TonB